MIKQKITLLETCKLPEVQLHSKISFFKSLVTKQSPEVENMKEKISQLSYSIKTIGVNGEEIGIVSKRLPFKFLESDSEKQKKMKKNIPIMNIIKNYVPHQTFYSHPLTTSRGQKRPQKNQNPLVQQLFVDSKTKNEFSATPEYKPNFKFQNRSKSMSNIKNVRNFSSKKSQNIEQIGRITSHRNSTGYGTTIPSNRKSYSTLLQNCNKVEEHQYNPLIHQENSMFKKIMKIKVNCEPEYDSEEEDFMAPSPNHQSIQRYKSSYSSFKLKRNSRNTQNK